MRGSCSCSSIKRWNGKDWFRFLSGKILDHTSENSDKTVKEKAESEEKEWNNQLMDSCLAIEGFMLAKDHLVADRKWVLSSQGNGWEGKDLTDKICNNNVHCSIKKVRLKLPEFLHARYKLMWEIFECVLDVRHGSKSEDWETLDIWL